MRYSPKIKSSNLAMACFQFLFLAFVILRPAVGNVWVGLVLSAVILLPYLVLGVAITRSAVSVDDLGRVCVYQWGRSIEIGRTGEVTVTSPNFHPLWKGRPVIAGRVGQVKALALWEAPFMNDDGRDAFVRLLLGGSDT